MFALKKRLQSFVYAVAGLRYMVAGQANARIHLLAMLTVLVAGLLTGLDRLEWALLVLVAALVFALEAVNTAVESLADALHPEPHPLIGRAKDVAAGAVLVSAVCSVIIAALVFLPHWFA